MVKKLLSITLALAIILLMVTSCSSQPATQESTPPETTGSEAAQEEATEQPEPITMQIIYYSKDMPTGGGPIEVELEKRMGQEVEVTWIPVTATAEKTTLALTGDFPEVIAVMNPEMKSQVVVDAVENGLFWDLTDKIPNYPNLSQIPDATFAGFKYDGRIFSLPKRTPMRQHGGTLYRQDWLDALNLEQPNTVESYYAMLQGFTNDDPDGNGVDDTVGMLQYDYMPARTATLAFGCTPWEMWLDEEGKILPRHMHPAFMDVLNFQRQAYSEGLINLDFAATSYDETYNRFISESGGAVVISTGEYTTGTKVDPLYDLNPDAQVGLAIDPTAEDGTKYAAAEGGYWGYYAINKTKVDEERLDEILTFFDGLCTDEMMKFLTVGIEGVHYTEEGGEFEWLDKELFDKDWIDVDFYIDSVVTNTMNYLDKSDPAIQAMIDYENNEDAIEFLRYESWFVAPEDGTRLDMVHTACTEYVRGELDEAGLNAVFDEWYAQTGEALIENYTAQYEVAMGIA